MELTRTALVLPLAIACCCVITMPAASELTGDITAKIAGHTAKDGRATARVRDSLRRIDRFDAQYHAVIAVDAAAALTDAATQDAKTAEERAELTLAGSVVMVKDNISMRGMPTTAGSLALAANHSERDAQLVAQLRDAGALMLGKTNLSEWANFRSEHSISGWSAIGGQTRNAIDRNRSPCGSSSGSAVAVALGYANITIGTETNGSIVCPAAVNGVVGFKPTWGLVSGQGIVPLATSQDTAGPITATVAQAALTLSVIAKPDYPEVTAGLLEHASLSDLQGIRIGVLGNSLGFDPRRDAALIEVLDIAAGDGAEPQYGLSLSPYPGFQEDAYAVLLYEFRQDIASYFAGLDNELADWDLTRLIAFNEEHASEELKLFDQGIFLLARDQEISPMEYRAAHQRIRRASREDGLDRLFESHRLDVILGVTVGPAWMIDEVNGDAFFGPSMSSYPAIAGNPHITLPLAQVGGLPLGISLVGKRFADHELARIAHRLERLVLAKRFPAPALKRRGETP